MTDDLVKMARLAQRDDRMATGALYGDLADRIEALVKERNALFRRATLAEEWRDYDKGRAEAAEAALEAAYFAGWADGSDTTSVTGDPTPDWEKYTHGSQK